MIFHDLDAEIPDSKRVPRLTSLSGANALITTIQVPPVSDILIKKHIEAGACFIRAVSAQQLQELDSEVLFGTLHKLIGLGAGSWQMVLLIDSSSKLLDFDKYIARVCLWQEHGGSVVDTFCNPTAMFLTKFEKRFLERANERKTQVHPLVAPRSSIEMVKDYRVTLATFPGIGMKGASVIQKQIREKDLGDDLLTALIYMTEFRKMKSKDKRLVDIVKMCRDWLGIPDDFDLDIKFTGAVVKEIKDADTV